MRAIGRRWGRQSPLILLRDIADISPAVFEKMVALRSELRRATDERGAMIERLGLDRAFALPSANWGPEANNDYQAAYRHLRDGGYKSLNRLRLWSQSFTGYQLRTMTPVHQLSPGRRIRSVARVSNGHDRWLKRQRSEPDRWVEIWQAAVAPMMPRYRVSPPKALGEIGWLIDDTVVNHDTYVLQERINLLFASGILDRLEQLGRPPRIIEIGGGYGGLCRTLRQLFPTASYTICDLPETLMFSGLYLVATEPGIPRVLSVLALDSGDAIDLLPNYLFPLFVEGRSFDLAINTLSFAEMSSHQVSTYADGLARLLDTEGLFFEQNQDNSPIGLLDPKPLISAQFSHRRSLFDEPPDPDLPSGAIRLTDTVMPILEGRADVWSNPVRRPPDA